LAKKQFFSERRCVEGVAAGWVSHEFRRIAGTKRKLSPINNSNCAPAKPDKNNGKRNIQNNSVNLHRPASEVNKLLFTLEIQRICG